MKYLLTLLLVLTSALAASASVDDSMSWLQHGKTVPNTEARKSINGFGAFMIITPDAEWESKWNSPPETIPEFSTTDRLKIGDQATILIFFGNPEPDAGGSVDVTCDVKIIRPDNRVTFNQWLKGFTGKLLGPVTNTYLTETIIKFVGEQTDPLGEWVVDVTVYDNHRHVSIPLRTKFTLVK